MHRGMTRTNKYKIDYDKRFLGRFKTNPTTREHGNQRLLTINYFKQPKQNENLCTLWTKTVFALSLFDSIRLHRHFWIVTSYLLMACDFCTQCIVSDSFSFSQNRSAIEWDHINEFTLYANFPMVLNAQKNKANTNAWKNHSILAKWSALWLNNIEKKVV